MTISDEVETKTITAYYARRTEFLAPLAASPGHVEQATITCANEAGVRAAIEAAVEAEREACAKIAMSYDHKGSIRICDPETWQREMSPQDVYDTGVCDVAVGIATAIRNRKSGARE